MKRLIGKHAALLVAVLLSSSSFAESTCVARSGRVDLGTLFPNARAELKAIDLGPAAPPGSSRLFSADAIRQAVREAGFDPREVHVSHSVRVESPARRLSSADFAELVRPAVERALHPGVVVKQIKSQGPVTLSPYSVVGDAELPPLPRRVGLVTLAATLQINNAGASPQRIPLTLVVQIDEQALAPDVKRGARVSLVIERGSATVSADGTAVEDADVGSLANFRVLKTNRVVRARLTSPLVAVVTEGT